MSNKAAFLLRDFNLNVLDYGTEEVVKSFSNLFFQNGFLPLIQRPTRVTRTSTTAIDYILPNRVLENKIQSDIIKTDIVSQYSRSWKQKKHQTKFIKHDVSSENIDTFKFLLENIKWDNILPTNSPDKTYETFHFIFSDLHDTAFPKRKIEIKT